MFKQQLRVPAVTGLAATYIICYKFHATFEIKIWCLACWHAQTTVFFRLFKTEYETARCCASDELFIYKVCSVRTEPVRIFRKNSVKHKS